MRYEIMAKVKDSAQAESIRNSLSGYGEISTRKADDGYIVYFNTKYPEYIELFKDKVRAKVAPVSFLTPNSTSIE
jgi:hypothetical protein